MRFLFYSHDGLGLGHTRRHIAVAAALAEIAPPAAILLATGAEELARLGLPSQVEILKLPGLRKENNDSYSSRRLPLSMEETRELRSSLLLTTVKSFRPDVVLVDKHPFGARGEFKAGLRAVRKLGSRAVLGLRDILDEPAQVLQEWRPHQMQKRIARYYDAVLIYGERAVFDPVSAYEFPPALARLTQFCGYVLRKEQARSLENFECPFPPRDQRTRPVVLATTGGGEDGAQLLEHFILASAGAAWQGVAIAGPMAPEAQFLHLEKMAHEHGVVLRHFVPHLSSLFGSIDALVTMGGYNSLVEAAAAGVPTVCIPRMTPRREQLIRAEAFEKLGLLEVCRPEELTAHSIAQAISRALRVPAGMVRKRAHESLHFEGAQRAALSLLHLARSPGDEPLGERLSASQSPLAVH